MSQSVNHGEKSVSSTGDTVEPVEATGPSQPTSAEPAEERTEPQTGAAASPAEAGNPDETPTVDLNDGSDDEEETDQESDDEAQDAQHPDEEPQSTSEAAADNEPAESHQVESVTAEPVATPATVRVLDEGATPAEVLSPYDSPRDLTEADAAARPSDAAEPAGHTAWKPDSGTMPPSIAPKRPAGAPSPSEPRKDATEVAAPAEAAAKANAPYSPERAGVSVEPVGAASLPTTRLEPAAKAQKVAKTDNAVKNAGKAAGGQADERPSSRRRRLIPAACAAGFAVLLLAWGGIAWWTTQHIASGTSVSGVDISGLSPKEARDRIGKEVGDRLAQPVTLTVGQGHSELVPSSSGVSVDADASVKRLTGFTLNPLTLGHRLSGQRTDAVIRVDAATLRGALEDRVSSMANGAVSATVTLEGTKPVTTPASNGVGLDVDASLKQLTGSWPLGKQTIAMPEGTAIPAITDEEATKFVDGTLKPLLSSGLTVDGAGTTPPGQTGGATAAAFSPQDIAGLLRISSEGGTLSAAFDPTALHDAVVARIGQVETPAQNATWKIDGSAAGAPGARPQYVPSAQGNVIDTAALSANLIKAGTSATDVAGRTVSLPMVVAEPTVTTPQNEWGITEPIGEYATPYNSGDAPRTQNLTRGAELVNGTVVKPGEVFSLEQTLGEVDYDHGFADAGVISNGQHVDSLGGGLSQVATTVFNAGFEAGMDDTEHHAHQYYFDRYPAGREATLWTGKLDVKFTNSTSNSVLVQAWLDGEQIHVRMWSTKYYDVSITSSERFNFRPVSTERKSGPGCEPYSGGNPGFDITVTRTRKHDGKAVPDDVITTQYAADNDIVCS